MLKRIRHLLDTVFDIIIWLNDRVMLYICIVWLTPILIVAALALTVIDLRIEFRSVLREQTLTALAGLPFWLGFCAYAQRSQQPWAARFREMIGWAPIAFGGALFVIGGLLYLWRLIWH